MPPSESPVEKRVREARLWAMGHRRQVIEAAVADAERLSRWAALGDRAAHLAAVLQTSRTEGGLVWTREAERPDGMCPSWWADDPPAWSELFFAGCGVTVGFPGGEAKIVTGEFAPPGPADPEPTGDWQMVAVPAGRGFEVYAPNGWRWVPDSDCVTPVVKELDRVPVTPDGLSALAEVVESIRPIRPDRRAFPILPARVAMVHRDDARAGRLFAPAARPNPQRGGSEVLPGFGPLRPEVMRTPALPLTLYDLGGGRSMTRGRGAPLALRIFVETVLSVPLEVRDRGAAFPLDPVRLRDFIRGLYPKPRAWRLSKDWPRLRDALAALGSPQALIPFEHADGRSWLRQVVFVKEFPQGNARMDDWLQFAVNLPPARRNGIGSRFATRAGTRPCRMPRWSGSATRWKMPADARTRSGASGRGGCCGCSRQRATAVTRTGGSSRRPGCSSRIPRAGGNGSPCRGHPVVLLVITGRLIGDNRSPFFPNGPRVPTTGAPYDPDFEGGGGSRGARGAAGPAPAPCFGGCDLPDCPPCDVPPTRRVSRRTTGV